jgi:hypothetical protein
MAKQKTIGTKYIFVVGGGARVAGITASSVGKILQADFL